MANNIYVGGFPYKTTKEDLARLFSACGKVLSAKVILDRETGRPKGFGFVEMSTDAEAKAAVEKLNGAFVGDRKIFVVSGRPQKGPAPKRDFTPRPAGARPGFAPKRDFAPRPADAKPGFVERRSGKDRRGAAAGAPAPDRRDAAPSHSPAAPPAKKWEKKPWEKKPFDPAKKPWAKKPSAAGKEPWPKKPFDKKKPWEKMKAPPKE
ncbi:MAG: hypothetical protein A2V88_03065 [Elusimicrobia bacterium RBG_16_66_12]|nr:MAG: hypothetical protein A2V88_03065 [Elusimicrobia bacterium RBG_16_66_12]